MAKVIDIAKEIEEFAPKFLKEDYDNVGLMVGDGQKEVKRVLLSLDCTNEVIEEAIDLNCDLIINHHPLLFKKPSSIVKGDLIGDKIIRQAANLLESCCPELSYLFRMGGDEFAVLMPNFPLYWWCASYFAFR